MAAKKSKGAEGNAAKDINIIIPEGTDPRRAAYLAKVAEVRKKCGMESMVIVGENSDDDPALIKQKVIPRTTGIPSVDRATKIGGLPSGRIVEILGPESSGKTTLVLHTIAEAQKKGAIVTYIDLEHALEADHMEACGVQPMDFSYPETAEMTLETVELLVPVCDIIVVDSVAAMSPKAESGKDYSDAAQPGVHAKLMSEAMRKLVGKVALSGVTVIFINQLRNKIGVTMPGASTETTPGGNALKFYSSMRLDMRRIGTETSGSEAYANTVRVKVIKNKCAPPYGQEVFKMYYDAKKTPLASVLDLGAQLGVISKAGTWYSYGEERLGQGLNNAIDFLLANDAIREEILEKMRSPETLFQKTVSKDDVL